MLKAKNLKSLLSQVLWNGVENAILVTAQGTVLSTQSVNESFPASAEHSLLVACVTNIWKSYSTNDLALPENDTAGTLPSGMEATNAGGSASGSADPSQQQQRNGGSTTTRSVGGGNDGGGGGAGGGTAGCQYVLLTIGDMRVCIVGVAKGEAILCLTGNQTVELGMLKLKAGGLQRQLDEPLRLAFGVM